MPHFRYQTGSAVSGGVRIAGRQPAG